MLSQAPAEPLHSVSHSLEELLDERFLMKHLNEELHPLQ